MLRNGAADAMFVYADQAKNYQCDGTTVAAWNCTLWEGFGTEYAYVQTGQFGYVVNGTTLALSKKGRIVIHEYNKETDEHSGDCSSGYCPNSIELDLVL
eukprot:s11076_g1.t1